MDDGVPPIAGISVLSTSGKMPGNKRRRCNKSPFILLLEASATNDLRVMAVAKIKAVHMITHKHAETLLGNIPAPEIQPALWRTFEVLPLQTPLELGKSRLNAHSTARHTKQKQQQYLNNTCQVGLTRWHSSKVQMCFDVLHTRECFGLPGLGPRFKAFFLGSADDGAYSWCWTWTVC